MQVSCEKPSFAFCEFVGVNRGSSKWLHSNGEPEGCQDTTIRTSATRDRKDPASLAGGFQRCQDWRDDSTIYPLDEGQYPTKPGSGYPPEQDMLRRWRFFNICAC